MDSKVLGRDVAHVRCLTIDGLDHFNMFLDIFCHDANEMPLHCGPIDEKSRTLVLRHRIYQVLQEVSRPKKK